MTESADNVNVVGQKTARNRNKPGNFKPGNKANPLGLAIIPPEERARRKAKKVAYQQVVESFKQAFFGNVEANTDGISKALIAKALKGDVLALKEINDRVLGKVKQADEGNDDVRSEGVKEYVLTIRHLIMNPMPLPNGSIRENSSKDV